MIVGVRPCPCAHQRQVLLRAYPAFGEGLSDSVAEVGGAFDGETLVVDQYPLDLSQEVVGPEEVEHPELRQAQHEVGHRDRVQGRRIDEDPLEPGHRRCSVLGSVVDDGVHRVGDQSLPVVSTLPEGDNVCYAQSTMTATGEPAGRQLPDIDETVNELA